MYDGAGRDCKPRAALFAALRSVAPGDADTGIMSPSLPHPPIRQLLNVLAFAVTLTVNALATLLPLNGVDPATISARFPSLFTPANYVFGIWGLIYTLLTAFVVYQALPAQRQSERLGRVGWLFALSCLLNTAWLFSWHYGVFWLSEVLMVGLLLSLIAIYQRLEIGRARHRGAGKWFLDLPFSVYLGWITVATVANTSIFLLDLGFDGGAAAPALTVLVIAVAAFIGLLALRLRSDLAFALVLAWAFVGIAVKQSGQTPSVVVAALAAAALLLLVGASWRGRLSAARA